MGIMSQGQKESRSEWRIRLKNYIECTKLDHNDENYWHPSDVIELIDEIPKYDLGDADRKKFLGMLGVEE